MSGVSGGRSVADEALALLMSIHGEETQAKLEQFAEAERQAQKAHAALKKRQDEHDSRETDLDRRETEVTEREKTVADSESSLARKHVELDQIRAEYDQKLKKLRALTQ